jgi:hypothetical protein
MSAATYAASRKTIKLAVCALIKSIAPTALILPRAVFKPEDSNWPNMLRSPDDANKIHSVQVFFRENGRAPNNETPPGYFNPKLGLGIGFYRLYEIGTDAENSEDALDAEISLVQYEIETNRNFGLSTVDTHEGLLDIAYNLTPPLGQSGRIHFGIGKLDILMSPLSWR